MKRRELLRASCVPAVIGCAGCLQSGDEVVKARVYPESRDSESEGGEGDVLREITVALNSVVNELKNTMNSFEGVIQRESEYEKQDGVGEELTSIQERLDGVDRSALSAGQDVLVEGLNRVVSIAQLGNEVYSRAVDAAGSYRVVMRGVDELTPGTQEGAVSAVSSDADVMYDNGVEMRNLLTEFSEPVYEEVDEFILGYVVALVSYTIDVVDYYLVLSNCVRDVHRLTELVVSIQGERLGDVVGELESLRGVYESLYRSVTAPELDVEVSGVLERDLGVFSCVGESMVSVIGKLLELVEGSGGQGVAMAANDAVTRCDSYLFGDVFTGVVERVIDAEDASRVRVSGAGV